MRTVTRKSKKKNYDNKQATKERIARRTAKDRTKVVYLFI